MNPHFVLTAGHCVTEARWLLVYLGVHTITQANDARLVAEDGIYIHPGYGFPTHDIALLRTTTTLTPAYLSGKVGTVCLGTEDLGVGDAVLAIGWGKTSDTATASNALKQVGLYLGLCTRASDFGFLFLVDY